MNLVLIGMRGCGKSNISRRLSRSFRRPVFSTDALISYENNGRSIVAILQELQGDWRRFREMEYEVVKKTACMDGVIIDCGGGVVVDVDDQGREVFSQRKMELLGRNGKIFWLKGDIARLAADVASDPSRPTLSTALGMEELMRLREPFYQRAADHVVNIERINRKIQTCSIVHLADFWH